MMSLRAVYVTVTGARFRSNENQTDENNSNQFLVISSNEKERKSKIARTAVESDKSFVALLT